MLGGSIGTVISGVYKVATREDASESILEFLGISEEMSVICIQMVSSTTENASSRSIVFWSSIVNVSNAVKSRISSSKWQSSVSLFASSSMSLSNVLGISAIAISRG